MTNEIARLHELGQSPWYDNLTRALLVDGGLAGLVDEGIRGVTSNPTIFEKAMASGDHYDRQLTACAHDRLTVEDSYWALVLDDVGSAADLLLHVYESSDRGDGFMSVEVSPDLARDTAATVEQVRSLAGRLGRPNVMIKIPATLEGLPAIEESLAAGINVNVTLIFSLARHDAVIEAYLRGIERLAESGGNLAQVASVASFFVSRVDTETDKRLPERHPLRGHAAVANARLAYRLFRERFAGPRWETLAAAGARVQRPLWASTSTKNPAYSPTLYVDELVGRDTVNTLAPPSIEALRAGEADLRADAVAEDVGSAEQVMEGLAAAGLDFDDVTTTLEREGVDAFASSFHQALATLEQRRATVAA